MQDLINSRNQAQISAGDQPNQQNESTFTREELSKYNGRDGNPAYVAVYGRVYDVTDVPAWASGTHVGMMAGTDVTGAITCHTGDPVLSRLKPVGYLGYD